MVNRPTRRLAVGLGLLALMAVVLIGTTTSALAQVPTGPFVGASRLTCAQGTGSAAPSGVSGTTACTIQPGGNYQLNTDYFIASVAAGTATTGTQAYRLWQLHQSTVAYPRWGHAAGTHWFYLFAENIASAAAGTAVADVAPQWMINYYAPPRRTVVNIATNATGTAGQFGAGAVGVASAPAGTAGTLPIIYAQTPPAAPIVIVSHVIVASSTVTSTSPTFGSFSLESSLNWGHGQEWWHAGTVVFSGRIDSATSTAATGTGSRATPATSGWISSGATLTLGNATTTQSISTTGNRTVTAGTSVPYVVSATDSNGDIERVKLAFRRPTTNTPMFYVAVRSQEDNADNTNPTCTGGVASQEYASTSEAYSAFPCGTSFTTTYLGTTSAGATSTITSSGGGMHGTSVTYTFNVVPSSAAVGTWNVYAQTSDFHGSNTGEVLLGTLTVQ